MTMTRDVSMFDAAPGFWDATYYTCDDAAEDLQHTDPEDAIEEALDRWMEPKSSVLEHLRSAVGETLTVYAYKRRVLDADARDLEWLLEDVMERLDEEYGDPNKATESSAAMKAATKKLAAAIRREYRVWRCEPCAKAVVNVEAWVREYRPEWLATPAPDKS